MPSKSGSIRRSHVPTVTHVQLPHAAWQMAQQRAIDAGQRPECISRLSQEEYLVFPLLCCSLCTSGVAAKSHHSRTGADIMRSEREVGPWRDFSLLDVSFCTAATRLQHCLSRRYKTLELRRRTLADCILFLLPDARSYLPAPLVRRRALSLPRPFACKPARLFFRPSDSRGRSRASTRKRQAPQLCPRPR